MTHRIFIGTEPAQRLATEVLKGSVLRRTKTPVEFIELHNVPLNLRLKMYTGFSFYRFYIPEACHYEGMALYLDADIIVLADIDALFSLDMGEKGVLARPMEEHPRFRYTSVMLMDTARLKHWKVQEWVTMINTGIISYQGVMEGRPGSPNFKDFGDLPPMWNHLDEYDETTKILHYTTIFSQPWKRPGHDFAVPFLKELKAALQEGIITQADVEAEIKLGHVYPTILEDVNTIC